MSPACSHAMLAAISISAWSLVRLAQRALAWLDHARETESQLVRDAERLAADEALRIKRLAAMRDDDGPDDYHGAPLFRTRPAFLSFDQSRADFIRSLEQIDGEPRP